jgi:hypothetical protein
VNPRHNWFADPEAPLLAVELQYYRVPRDDWELMLTRMRQMGANTISTYVMWGWHEPEKGRFDFTGASHPGRGLVGFVQSVREMGFGLLIKPGPFIDAEVETLAPGLAQAVEEPRAIAGESRAAEAGPLSIEEYRAAYGSAAEALEGPGAVFIDALRRVRAALASGELLSTEQRVERDLTRALGLLARTELRPE